MSLGLKERTANDPLEVRALFALHRIYGQDGRLWIKNEHSKRKGGEVYRTLMGGVHAVSNKPEFKRVHMRDSMFNLLYSGLPQRYRSARILSYAGAIIDFNDSAITTWSDVERTIAAAIEIGRKRANGD